MITEIKVTKSIILKGCFKDGDSCPIALSVNKKLNKISCWSGTKYLEIKEQRIKLPKIAMDFIDSFDSGMDVKPFKFKLNIRKIYLK